jgi:MFS family permease
VWIQNVTSAVVAYTITGSTLVVGLVSTLQFLAPLLLTLWAGGLADRHGKVRILLIGQLISGSGALTLAVWIGAVGVEGLPGVAPVLVIALITGLGFAITAPAMQAIVPSLVAARDIDQAVALSSLVINISRVVGPAVGAIALAVGGPALAYATNVLGHIAFIIYLFRARSMAPDRARSSERTSILGTLRIVSSRRELVFAIAMVGVFGFSADPTITLAPALSDRLGMGEDGVALLVTAFGAGSLLSAFIYRRLREWVDRERVVHLSLVLQSISLAGIAVAPTPAAAYALFVAGGAAFFVGVSSITAFVHGRVDDAVRGRVMAVWSMAFLGVRPLGALVNGFVGDFAGVDAAFVLAGCTPLVMAVLGVRERRRSGGWSSLT